MGLEEGASLGSAGLGLPRSVREPTLWDLKSGQSFLRVQTHLSWPTASFSVSKRLPSLPPSPPPPHPAWLLVNPGSRKQGSIFLHLPRGFFPGTWRFKGPWKVIHPS